VPRRSRRSSTARALTAGGVALAVVVVGAMTAYASTRNDQPSYRTATVSTQTVQQTLEATGTVEPGSSATVSFPVSGTVATVRVAMGSRVQRGEVLATLSTTALTSALASARSAQANAALTLHQDVTGQSSAASGSSGGSGGSGGSSGSGSSGSSGSGSSRSASAGSSGGSTKALAAAQQRLLGTVRLADAALATATADLATATTLCGPTPTTPPAPTTPAPTTPGAPTTPPAPPTTCAQAQALVLADETKVQQLQTGVSQQEAQLDKLLATALKSASRTSSASSTGSTSRATTTTTVSAARLAADQAAVDAAEAQVAVARENLAQAVLTSPMDGVVSSVGLTVGSTATAGSASSAVDVIDPDSHQVTVDVDVTKVPLVKVGQHATVVPDGTSTPLAATVSYVAAVPATSGGTSYEVRLAFTTPPTGLHDGIQAAVALVVAQATGLAVPTSAVGHLGSISYVLVAEGSTTKRQLVSVGAVGTRYTLVTRGLTAGQRVVLANLDEPIPTNSLTNRFGRFAGAGTGGLGGLGGGGLVVGGGGAAPGRG